MITDSDKLCAYVGTTAAALSHLGVDLAGTCDRGQLDGGLRDALCALIDRNKELTERLICYVEATERAKGRLREHGA